ncbi:Hypothetical predicted protein [Lecanosticta acicola]|uniref:Alternative oxidase n=1 Tax=Lecanosticta acicola TaxID=111012 RepID=A0AAI9EEM1_9PEZI|nr:Hypothetical predicted protein [Lecanosticta acicola]
MHLSTSTVRQQPPTVLVALLALSLLPLYIISYQIRLRFPLSQIPGTESLGLDIPPSPVSQDFVTAWLATDLVQPFDPYPLARYCNTTGRRFNPNLVFNLANANGGLGNVRGNILDFIFFAIEAGASIILPGFAGRDSENIGNVWGGHKHFGEFFDQEWFVETMGKVCPEMEVYVFEEGMKMKEAVNGERGNYMPRTRRMDSGFENTWKAAVEQLEGWLREVKTDDEAKDQEAGGTTMVNLERTLWDVDTRSLPLGVRRNFGQMVRLRPDVRRLAAVAVQNLALRFGLDIDPGHAIPRHAFYGAHLRTEADAGGAGWLDDANANFSAQTDAYIEQSLKHKLRVMYVATGDESELALFREKASKHKPAINITSKYDLLPAREAAELKGLTWDQRALVDYEVLKRSSIFGGFVKSSFSYNVAMARNQWLEDQAWMADPWYAQHTETGVSFDDGLSRILGRDGWHEGRIPRGMWP